MTNPDNAIGTNAAYGGRTSVNARNDVLGLFSGRGVLSGWVCSPDSGMTVVLGGDGSTRDVAIVEDASGNRTTVDNISGSPVPVTLPAAPASNSRIDSIVAYVNNPPSGSATVIDNPEACGIIAVSGTASSSPQVPNDTAIRQAITADGASGSTAYYVVLANVTVASGTTDIVADNIQSQNFGSYASIVDSGETDGINYIKFNNGLKIQWGTVTQTTGATSKTAGGITFYSVASGSGAAVTFPLEYSNSNYSLQFTSENANSAALYWAYPAQISNSGFRVNVAGTTSNSVRTIRWLAIGY